MAEPKQIRDFPTSKDLSKGPQVLPSFRTYNSKGEGAEEIVPILQMRISSPQHSSRAQVISPAKQRRFMSPSIEQRKSVEKSMFKHKPIDESLTYQAKVYELAKKAAAQKTPKRQRGPNQSQSSIPQIVISLAAGPDEQSMPVRDTSKSKPSRNESPFIGVQREDSSSVDQQQFQELSKRVSVLQKQLQLEEEKTAWTKRYWKNKLNLFVQKSEKLIQETRDDHKIQLVGEREVAEETIKKLNEQVAGQDQLLSELKMQVDCHNEIKEKEIEQAEKPLKQEIQDLKKANQQLREKVASQEVKIANLQNPPIVIDLNEHEMQIKIETLEQANLEQQNKQKLLSEQLTSQTVAHKMQQQVLQKKLKKLKHLSEKQLAEAKSQEDNLTTDLKQLNKEIQQLKTDHLQLQVFKETIQNLQVQIEVMQNAQRFSLNKVCQLENECAKLQLTNSQLNTQAQKNMKKANELQLQMNEGYQKEKAKLMLQIEQLKQESVGNLIVEKNCPDSQQATTNLTGSMVSESVKQTFVGVSTEANFIDDVQTNLQDEDSDQVEMEHYVTKEEEEIKQI